MLLERLGCCSSPEKSATTFAATAGDPNDDNHDLSRSPCYLRTTIANRCIVKNSNNNNKNIIEETKNRTRSKTNKFLQKPLQLRLTKDQNYYCSSYSSILRRLAYWNLFSLALFLWACGVSDAESPNMKMATNENLNYNNNNNDNNDNNWTSPLGDYYYSLYGTSSATPVDVVINESDTSDSVDSNVTDEGYVNLAADEDSDKENDGYCYSKIGDIFKNNVHRKTMSRRSRSTTRQCKPFNKFTIDEICNKTGFERLYVLNDTFPFADCLSLGDLNLYRLLGLSLSTLTPTKRPNYQKSKKPTISTTGDRKTTNKNINNIYYNTNTAALDLPKLAHLDRSLDDCVSDHSSYDGCRNCYRNLSVEINRVVEAYENFSTLVLSKLNCELGNDIRYSAIFNCSHCKFWYKRWLLLTMKGVWSREPCVEWCHLAELACPHMQARKDFDYAGLPSFRCTDVSIPNFTPKQLKPDCIKPCDDWSKTLGGALNADASNNHDAKSIKNYFDLYCKENQKSSSAIRPSRQMYYTKKKRKHSAASSASSSAASGIFCRHSTTPMPAPPTPFSRQPPDDGAAVEFSEILNFPNENNVNFTTNRPILLLLTLLRKFKLQTMLLLVLYYLTLMMMRRS